MRRLDHLRRLGHLGRLCRLGQLDTLRRSGHLRRLGNLQHSRLFPASQATPALARNALSALMVLGLLTGSPASLAAAQAATAVVSAAPSAPTVGHGAPDLADQSRALQRASDAVLGVQVVALENARSVVTLGRSRSGSGVLIGGDGLVLTIGYLVLEAERVQLVLDSGRRVPARVLGYDVATGFGLLQALAPLPLTPVPLGRPDALGQRDALMVVSGGGDGGVSAAQLVSRRAFSGYWEYHIEGALFTAPARRDHSGAGLFNAAGELVGIGSLYVADTGEPTKPNTDVQEPRQSGNMFVPVDLLVPILDELRQRGSSAASKRAWLGMNCVEQVDGLRVVRVSDDSPADVAGLLPGDRILRIDGTEVRALATLWQSLWAGGAPEREITLLIERNNQAQTVKVFSVDRMKTLRREEGI